MRRINSQDGIISLAAGSYDEIVYVDVRGNLGVKSHVKIGYDLTSPSFVTSLGGTSLNLNTQDGGPIFIRPDESKVEILATKVLINTKNGDRYEFAETGGFVINEEYGTEGQVLMSHGPGVAPSWASLTDIAEIIGGTDLDNKITLGSKEIAFGDENGDVISDAKFTYDSEFSTLKIGGITGLKVDGDSGTISVVDEDSPLILAGGGGDKPVIMGSPGDTTIEGTTSYKLSIKAGSILELIAPNSHDLIIGEDHKFRINTFGAIAVGDTESTLSYGEEGYVLQSSGQYSPPKWVNPNESINMVSDYVGIGQMSIKNTDAGKHIRAYPTDDMVLVVRDTQDQFMKVGTVLTITLMNTGTLQITSDPDVQLLYPVDKKLKPRVRYSTITMRMVENNEWIVSGDMEDV